MRSLALPVILVASVSSSQALELSSVTGVWSVDGANCTRRASNETLLSISEARFRYHDVECRIREATPASDVLNLRVSCDAGGKQEIRDFVLRLRDNSTLIVTQGQTATTYMACDRRNAGTGAQP